MYYKKIAMSVSGHWINYKLTYVIHCNKIFLGLNCTRTKYDTILVT